MSETQRDTTVNVETVYGVKFHDTGIVVENEEDLARKRVKEFPTKLTLVTWERTIVTVETKPMAVEDEPPPSMVDAVRAVSWHIDNPRTLRTLCGLSLARSDTREQRPLESITCSECRGMMEGI